MRRRVLLALPLAAAWPLRARPQTAPLRVVASFSILGDLTRQVVGEEAEVATIVGPDADAHHVQPRPSHIEAIRRAAMVVRNGLGFDGWFERALQAASFRGVAVTASEGFPTRPAPRRAGGHAHGPHDPHIWQDVAGARHMLGRILAGAERADPARAEAHRARAAAADRRLAELDAWIRAEIARIPPERRVVLTSHDAFGYFAAAYGVRFLAPLGISPQAEPSAQQVAALIRQVRAQNITAVFIENMTNPALLERLAAEAGVRVRGRLYADALSGPDGPAPDYEAMMRHNLRLMLAAWTS
ncbi:MAG: zinc ABC transporter substrate-binding protein [Rhodovarius sp.]|nr:zinc ABC transporter substrate-binding protein [Rhodovarius sp.]MCX7931171.1 zinc ABC transporter substrate-binding protein [Rhodovarius sp.]MDW8313434.1 zinc ABC transporter substrate-binding protein [Rhodovarius sp.]